MIIGDNMINQSNDELKQCTEDRKTWKLSMKMCLPLSPESAEKQHFQEEACQNEWVSEQFLYGTSAP